MVPSPCYWFFTLAVSDARQPPVGKQSNNHVQEDCILHGQLYSSFVELVRL